MHIWGGGVGKLRPPLFLFTYENIFSILFGSASFWHVSDW